MWNELQGRELVKPDEPQGVSQKKGLVRSFAKGMLGNAGVDTSI